MRFRDAILRSFGPGPFTGVTLARWSKTLCDNRFSVDWPYWPRAAVITLGSIPNTLIGCCEAFLYNRRIEASEVQSPLFILGVWRSGTTHLHNLLAIDDRFGFPNFYQVNYPKTFLLTEGSTAWLMHLCIPKVRAMDNVKLDVTEPQEEEYAMCSLTGQSILLAIAFPRNAQFYDRFLALRDVSNLELRQWKAGLMSFLKKLSFKYRRPLVLKSPGNTCRINVLLDLFPDAKFVHIRRHPYDVFQSMKHTVWKTQPWYQLQRADAENDDDWIINQYKESYDGFFSQRHLIPQGKFHEVTFEDLERDPVGQIEDTYKALGLPDFKYVENQLRSYVHSLSAYEKNVFPPLSLEVRHRISTECRRCFDEWGYPE